MKPAPTADVVLSGVVDRVFPCLDGEEWLQSHDATIQKPIRLPGEGYPMQDRQLWRGPQRKDSRRRPMRLRGYDYSQHGAYFVTICTRNRACLLGDVIEGEMHLSEAGHLAKVAWEDLPSHYPNVRLDAWTIMPNHVHGIIALTDTNAESVGAGLKPAPTQGAKTQRGLR